MPATSTPKGQMLVLEKNYSEYLLCPASITSPFLHPYSCIWCVWKQIWFSSGHCSERQRVDAFELWCWRRLLRVPWTAKRSNQPILKEISPEYSLEGLILKLKLQYFGNLMWRTDSFEKTLMLGKIKGWGEGDDRGWDGWMASPTQWTWVWVNSGSWWWTWRPGMMPSMGSQSRTWLSNWTELKECLWYSSFCCSD